MIWVQFNGQNFKFKGAGIYGAGITTAHHYKNNLSTPAIIDTVTGSRYYYPQTHISKEYINWSAGGFAEFLLFKKILWQTELEYANKGAREMEILDRKELRSGSYGLNKYTYIQWNNYYKSFYPLAYGMWYWMAGVRLEYLFKKSAGVFVPWSANMKSIWFSGDLGIGYEMPIFEKYHLFVEGHWNPDIIPQTQDYLKIRSRSYEVRLGVVYRLRRKRVDDCNAPVYKGPAY